MQLGMKVVINKSPHVIRDLWNSTGEVVAYNKKDDLNRVKLDTPVRTPVSLINVIWVKTRDLG